MITYESILRKITGKLTEMTGNKIEVVAEDFSESIIRPSFKIDIDSTAAKFNAELMERGVTCRIYYFARDRTKYKLDNLKMQQKLEKAFFDKLEVEKGFFIFIEELEFETTDTVLICSFNFTLLEDSEQESEENYENMEELEWH